MYDRSSIELEARLQRDRLFEQAEMRRLVRIAQASHSGDRKPVIANIQEKLASLGLWLKAVQVRLQVS